MNYFGLPFPPSCLLHDRSRQLQGPSTAKIHWLNGTTVPPQCQTVLSDDARCWHVSHVQTRVAVDELFFLLGFQISPPTLYQAKNCNDRTHPLSLIEQPSLERDSWLVQTVLAAAGTALRETVPIVIHHNSV